MFSAAPVVAQEADPIIGTWKLDVKRSRFAPALQSAPPRELIEVLRHVDGGRIELYQQEIRRNGTRTTFRITYPARGGTVTLLDAPGTDGLTFVETRIRAGHWIVTVLRAGQQVFVREKLVSADGKTKRETVRGMDERGCPFQQLEVYARISP